MAEKPKETIDKKKTLPAPKWRTPFQIATYTIASIVLIFLGIHGIINLEERKTIMIFGDQDNATHNAVFAFSYFILGVIGVVCTFTDIKEYRTRKKEGYFLKENQ